jgi:hypothetical protein
MFYTWRMKRCAVKSPVILKESSGQAALQATIHNVWLPVWLSIQKILPE